MPATNVSTRPRSPATSPSAAASSTSSPPAPPSPRGGILDIFPAGGTVVPASSPNPAPASSPVRIDFFGDDVEKITEVDPDTLGSGRALARVELVAAAEEAGRPRDTDISFLELLPAGTLAL